MLSCPKCGTGISSAGSKATCPTCGASFDTAPTGTLLAPPKATPDLGPVPSRLGKYDVLSAVARGGMGVIYRGRQPELDRVVALKVISPQFAAQPSFIDRFFQEARTLAKLNHPNIVQIYDAARDGDQVFLVMEFVDGQSLRAILRQRRLSPDETLRLIPPICDALTYAHSQGIVHRDIKPENILISRKGEIKITDFGLAVLKAKDSEGHRLTATDMVMGTLDYMAPEQRMGAKNVDHRADLYALGVILYELLTGKLPIGRFDPPSSMGFDRRLDPVVLRALDQEPEQRYQDALEIKDRLTRISTSGMTTAPQQPPPVSTTAPTRPVTARPEGAQRVEGPHKATTVPVQPTPAPVHYSTAPIPPPPSRSGWNPFLVVAIIVGIVVLLTCTGMVLVIAFAESNPRYEPVPIELPAPPPDPEPPPDKG